MLTFARSFLRQVRILISRTLDLPPRLLHFPVQFSSGPHGLVIRAHVASGLAAQYEETTPRPPCELVTSLELLKAVEGSHADSATLIATDDGQITARWIDGPIPRTFSQPPLGLNPELVFPTLPSWSDNPPGLWPALAAAQGTTDPDSSRYALGCIQLRGKTGVIGATDGRQLLRQTGFEFGWEDEVLIPGSKLFPAHCPPADQPVQVGRLEKQIVLRTGPWTFWLPIQEGRFPRVDDAVPSPTLVTTRLSLPPAQHTFLRENLRRLRCEELNDSVTLEINGQVAVRSRESASAPPTELRLTRASHTGPDMRIVCNRRCLQRSLDLGFTEFSFISPEAAVHCREANRQYVWMPHDPQSAVQATADTVVIESPDSMFTTRRGHRQKRASAISNSVPVAIPSGEVSPSMPTPSTTETSAAPTSTKRRKSASSASKISLIEQAIAVRTKLRELLAETNELLRAAKRQKQQERLVRSTLDSLKQLQQAG